MMMMMTMHVENHPNYVDCEIDANPMAGVQLYLINRTTNVDCTPTTTGNTIFVS